MGTYLSTFPRATPAINRYVTNPMTGMYRSGALISYLGMMGSSCWLYLIDHSCNIG